MVALSGYRLLRVGFLTTACFAASSAERDDSNPDSVPQLVAAATGQMAEGIAKMLAEADTSLGKGEENDAETEYFSVPGASVPTSAATALARLERRLHASSTEISQWATASEGGQSAHGDRSEEASSHVSKELQSLRHAIDKVRASAGVRASAAEKQIAGLKGERDRLAADLKAHDLAVRSESVATREAVHLEDYLGWNGSNHDSHKPSPQPVVHEVVTKTDASVSKKPASAATAAKKANATAPKVAQTAKAQTTKREWPKELTPPAALRGAPMSDNLKNWLSGKPLVTPAPPRVHQKPKIVATNSHLLAAKDILNNLGNAVDVLGGHVSAADVPAKKSQVGKAAKEGEAYEGDPRLLAAEEMLGHTAESLPHHQHHAADGSPHHKHHHRHQQHHQHKHKKA